MGNIFIVLVGKMKARRLRRHLRLRSRLRRICRRLGRYIRGEGGGEVSFRNSNLPIVVCLGDNGPRKAVKVVSRCLQGGFKIIPKWSQDNLKVVPRWSQVVSRRFQGGLKIVSK